MEIGLRTEDGGWMTEDGLGNCAFPRSVLSPQSSVLPFLSPQSYPSSVLSPQSSVLSPTLPQSSVPPLE